MYTKTDADVQVQIEENTGSLWHKLREKKPPHTFTMYQLEQDSHMIQ